jgi:hypothetical protein
VTARQKNHSTYQINPGGSGGSYSFLFIVFLRYSWSRRSSSAWYFSAAGKGLGPAAMSGYCIPFIKIII